VNPRSGTDGLRGLPRILRATRIGLGALRWGFRHEEAIRWELLSWLLFLPLAFWLGANGVERALLAGSTILVLLVELLNTSIEVVVDRISTERHELSGLAKDLGSAAVAISLLIWALTWALVLWDRWS
jgi:diacylglycerol kinase (ATP)